MTAEIWGTPVAYEERGEGRPLVAIHGWTGCRLQMTERLEPVFAELPGYRRIYLDLPGMGETPPCTRVRNTDEMLAFVRAFIDRVVGESTPYLVAGHSYGGGCWRRRAAGRPEASSSARWPTRCTPSASCRPLRRWWRSRILCRPCPRSRGRPMAG